MESEQKGKSISQQYIKDGFGLWLQRHRGIEDEFVNKMDTCVSCSGTGKVQRYVTPVDDALNPFKYHFSNTDIDHIMIGPYKKIMPFYLLEFKSFSGGGYRPSFSQFIAHYIINEACKLLDGKTIEIPMRYGPKPYTMSYGGFHKLICDRSSPDDSQNILWCRYPMLGRDTNYEQRITLEELLKRIRFEVPVSLN